MRSDGASTLPGYPLLPDIGLRRCASASVKTLLSKNCPLPACWRALRSGEAREVEAALSRQGRREDVSPLGNPSRHVVDSELLDLQVAVDLRPIDRRGHGS